MYIQAYTYLTMTMLRSVFINGVAAERDRTLSQSFAIRILFTIEGLAAERGRVQTACCSVL